MTETTQPSLTQRVAGAAAWNLLLFPVQFAVGLIASVLTLNYLPPAEYGVLALLTGLAATIGLYADLGIERSLPRFLPEVERRAGRGGVARFLRRIIALKLALVVLFVVGLQLFSAPLIGWVAANEQQHLAAAQQHVTALTQQRAPEQELQRAVQDEQGKQAAIDQLQQNGRLFLWAVSALVLFGAIYDVFMAFLTAYFKQRAWNIITAGVALLQPLLVTGFILLDWGLGGVLLGMVITPVIAIGLAAWQTARAARELAPGAPAAPPDPALARRFAGFAGMSFITQLTNWFYDVAFVVFVLAALGLSLQEVALLSFAYTFAKSNLGYAYLPFGGLLTPLLTRIRGRGDPAALQETYGSMTRLFALILIPAGIGLVLLTPRLLALLYPRYASTAVLAYVLIAFCFLESILSVPHNVLMVYDRYRPLLLARLLALISVPLLALLVPRFGVIGAAVAVGVARVLPRVITLVAVRRSMGLRFPLRFVGRVLAATLAFGVPLLLLLPAWPLPPDAQGFAGKAAAAAGLGALAALSALGYLLALRLLGGLDEQERKRILSLKLPFKNTLARLL
jgi:O-antigen/teichoic acid export membrane protein